MRVFIWESVDKQSDVVVVVCVQCSPLKHCYARHPARLRLLRCCVMQCNWQKRMEDTYHVCSAMDGLKLMVFF